MKHWGKKKQVKVIGGVLGILVLAIVALSIYHEKRDYHEQTVMAKKYMEAGNYEAAIAMYKKVLAMNQGNRELLSIKLAEAYCAIYDYDKALEILRQYYISNNSNEVKEKIEEISSLKNEFIFNQTIAKADTYFSNGEYEKAISEYEKAKSIKSKEAISYEKIAEAYIAMNEYDMAKSVVDNGLAITQDTKLESILDKIDAHLLEGEYNTLIESAMEFIAQENYEEAKQIYRKAIGLLPKKDTAYQKLSEVYILEKNYNAAIDILDNALAVIKSDILEEQRNKVYNLIDDSKKRQLMLKELYGAVSNGDVDKILSIIDSSFYKNKIASTQTVIFEPDTLGAQLIIYDDSTIYAGGMDGEMKKGMGTLFTLYKDKDLQGWYYYKGEWSNDLPNGMGLTKEYHIRKDKNGNENSTMVLTQGTFLYGAEHSQMEKVFYENDKEIGTIIYRAKNGVPQAMTDEKGNPILDEKKVIIAYWIRDGVETEDYYAVDPKTIWTVSNIKN